MLIVLYLSNDEPQLAHFTLRCCHCILVLLIKQYSFARSLLRQDVMALVIYRVDAGTVSAVLRLQALTIRIYCLLIGRVLVSQLWLSELAEIDKE